MGGDRKTGVVPGRGASAQPRDRRATNRAAIEIPAVLRLGNRDLHGTVRDLSTKGIALTLNESVPPGMVVRVAFRLPNARRTMEVAGVLVRQTGGRVENTVGLQFVHPDSDAMRDIQVFVQRNRSDGPFSREGENSPAAAREGAGESEASLEGLFQRAVEDMAEKEDKPRGLLARWLSRGKP